MLRFFKVTIPNTSSNGELYSTQLARNLASNSREIFNEKDAAGVFLNTIFRHVNEMVFSEASILERSSSSLSGWSGVASAPFLIASLYCSDDNGFAEMFVDFIEDVKWSGFNYDVEEVNREDYDLVDISSSFLKLDNEPRPHNTTPRRLRDSLFFSSEAPEDADVEIERARRRH